MTQTKFVSDELSTLTAALAGRIRDARFAANLTQRELAQELDVSTRSVQDWEAGKSLPRPSMRRKLDALFARTEGAQ